jgi:carboxypeptidase PM20D1
MILDLLVPLAIILGVILLFLIGFILLKTALFSIPQKEVKPRGFVEVDGQSVAERLSLAVQQKTVSFEDPEKVDGNAFLGLHRLLRTLYPQVHSQLKVETVNDYSLLYTWEGKDTGLEPVMLTAHLDVVPADESDDGGWTYPPFRGEIANGYVWGRGTLDVKNAVISILEAVEYLLKQEFQPERTVYLGFGHDEEIYGWHGALNIAELLEARGVSLGCLLDEGGAVTEDFLPGVDAPVGVIGISEKGFLSLRLSVETLGGHSSTPPQETAIGILSRAIANLESHPMPPHLEVVEFLMSYIGSALPFFQRMLFANTWLFGGLLKKRLAKSGVINASMRTTTAPTIIKAGVKDNILPAKAEAVVNFRIFPGDDLRSVYEMIQDRINDERVKVSPMRGDVLEGDAGWNPSSVADTESPFFHSLSNLIREAFPGSLTAPYLSSVTTDARHYNRLTENTFRFFPVLLPKDELKTIHGVDERLSIDNCGRMVGFYIAYIEEIANLADDVDREDQDVEVKVLEDDALEEDVDDFVEDIPEELLEAHRKGIPEDSGEDLSDMI